VNKHLRLLPSKLICLQLRASWSAALPGCIVFNTDNSKLNIIVLFITDLVLLVTMLGGLLRFRRDVGGTCSVERLLWKQVG